MRELARNGTCADPRDPGLAPAAELVEAQLKCGNRRGRAHIDLHREARRLLAQKSQREMDVLGRHRATACFDHDVLRKRGKCGTHGLIGPKSEKKTQDLGGHAATL